RCVVRPIGLRVPRVPTSSTVFGSIHRPEIRLPHPTEWHSSLGTVAGDSVRPPVWAIADRRVEGRELTEQQDRQVEQAAQHALDEIARIHERAVNAVWKQYPAPTRQPRRPMTDPSKLGLS